MILSYKMHNVAPYINWIYFFHAWGFQPRFAAIANIHGCDVCRASWLTTFPEEDRNKASEAMQLFKEANRMLDLLDKDYEVRTIFKQQLVTQAKERASIPFRRLLAEQREN